MFFSAMPDLTEVIQRNVTVRQWKASASQISALVSNSRVESTRRAKICLQRVKLIEAEIKLNPSYKNDII